MRRKNESGAQSESTKHDIKIKIKLTFAPIPGALTPRLGSGSDGGGKLVPPPRICKLAGGIGGIGDGTQLTIGLVGVEKDLLGDLDLLGARGGLGGGAAVDLHVHVVAAADRADGLGPRARIAAHAAAQKGHGASARDVQLARARGRPCPTRGSVVGRVCWRRCGSGACGRFAGLACTVSGDDKFGEARKSWERRE